MLPGREAYNCIRSLYYIFGYQEINSEVWFEPTVSKLKQDYYYHLYHSATEANKNDCSKSVINSMNILSI